MTAIHQASGVGDVIPSECRSDARFGFAHRPERQSKGRLAPTNCFDPRPALPAPRANRLALARSAD